MTVLIFEPAPAPPDRTARTAKALRETANMGLPGHVLIFAQERHRAEPEQQVEPEPHDHESHDPGIAQCNPKRRRRNTVGIDARAARNRASRRARTQSAPQLPSCRKWPRKRRPSAPALRHAQSDRPAPRRRWSPRRKQKPQAPNRRATGLANVDLSVIKNTPLTERVDLQFRAEFFNALNHTNLGVPNSIVFSGTTVSPSAGLITTTATTFPANSTRIEADLLRRTATKRHRRHKRKSNCVFCAFLWPSLLFSLHQRDGPRYTPRSYVRRIIEIHKRG